MKDMLINLLKWLFSASAILASLYSMETFGAGLWSFLFLAIGLLVLLSLWIRKINPVAVVLARIAGVLSLLALGLLLLAATTGGSFRLSDSNQDFALMLALLSMFGLSAFGWPGLARDKKNQQ